MATVLLELQYSKDIPRPIALLLIMFNQNTQLGIWATKSLVGQFAFNGKLTWITTKEISTISAGCSRDKSTELAGA